MNKNNLKTAVLLAALGGLIMVISEVIFGGMQGLTIGLVIAFVMTFFSYWFSDKLAIKASRAQPVTESEAPQLYRLTRELTTQANLPMPRLYVIPSEQPNAFATGRNPQHSAVAVTQGIVQILDEDELKGVLAHELMHIKNRDILISSVAAAVAMGIMFTARMAMWGAMFGGGRGNDRGGGNIIGMLAMMILAPLAAGMIQMALSRSREFEADHDAAFLIGQGDPLARALEKLQSTAERVPAQVHPAQAPMYIVNPLSGRKANFAALFSTHPPTEERTARLRAINPHVR
ncbi:MAG: zinc metalloprotease HtpX [Actinomycetota bacterium]